MPNMLVKISDDPRKFMNFSILWEKTKKKNLRKFFFEKYHPANKKNHKNLDWYYQNELILRTVND